MSMPLYRRIDSIVFWVAVGVAVAIALALVITLWMLNLGSWALVLPAIHLMYCFIVVMVLDGVLLLVNELILRPRGW